MNAPLQFQNRAESKAGRSAGSLQDREPQKKHICAGASPRSVACDVPGFGDPIDTAPRPSASHPGHAFSQIRILNRSGSMVRRKMLINEPGDRFEHEADRVADQVMRMSNPGVHPTPEINAPPIVFDTHSSPGQPLGPATRAFFEPRFGHDFSRVRIHTDGPATQSARALNARAFTIGQNVVFGPGQYAPETRSGQLLLAHELTHVVQQTGGATAAHAEIGGDPATGPGPAGFTPGSPTISGTQNSTIQREEAPTPTQRIGATVADYWLPLPEFVKATVVDQVIDLAIKTVEDFPGKYIAGSLWIFLKEGLLGFYTKLKSTAQDVKIRVVDKIAKIIAGKDQAFTMAFLKGLLKGFFIDGALGIFIAIWELIKGLGSVWDFLKNIGRSIGGFPEAIRSLLQGFDNRALEFVNSIGPAIEELKRTYLDPSQAGSLSNVIVEKGKAFAKQGGEAIAEKLLSFFSKPEASAEIGETVGDLIGMALWEVVFALLTAGAGAALTAIKEGTGTIAKILAKVVSGVLKVVEEIKQFFGKVVDIVKEAVAFVKGKLKELSGKFVELLEDVEAFLAKLLRVCEEHSPMKCKFEGAEAAGAETKLPEPTGRRVTTEHEKPRPSTEGKHEIGKSRKARQEAAADLREQLARAEALQSRMRQLASKFERTIKNLPPSDRKFLETEGIDIERRYQRVLDEFSPADIEEIEKLRTQLRRELGMKAGTLDDYILEEMDRLELIPSPLD
jgi:Domain of unknown function (DUF4157)